MKLYYDSTNPDFGLDINSTMAVKAYQMRVKGKIISLKEELNIIPAPYWRMKVIKNCKSAPVKYDLQKTSKKGHDERCYEITKEEYEDLINKHNGA